MWLHKFGNVFEKEGYVVDILLVSMHNTGHSFSLCSKIFTTTSVQIGCK